MIEQKQALLLIFVLRLSSFADQVTYDKKSWCFLQYMLYNLYDIDDNVAITVLQY